MSSNVWRVCSRVGDGGIGGVGGRSEAELSVATWVANAAIAFRAFTSLVGGFSFRCGVDDCDLLFFLLWWFLCLIFL